MSRQHEEPLRQDRTTLIISGGRLLDTSIPAGTFRNVGEELKAIYGSDCLKDDEFLQSLGWLDEDGDAIFANAPYLLRNLTFDAAYTEPQKLYGRLGTQAAKLGLRRVPGFVPGEPFEHVAYRGTAAGLQRRLNAAGVKAEVRTHYFTRDEHAVLSAYLNQWPDEAVESLGTDSLPESVVAGYADQIARGESDENLLEGAVASILLRSIQHELPWFGGGGPKPANGVRWQRPRSGNSGSSILPIHLLTINWASSGPGIDWPDSYYLCWVPVYDRYVVTVSADSEESIRGRMDVAIHSFAADGDLMSEVKAAIFSDWETLRMQCEQERWERVYSPGLVSVQEAEEWADEVWFDEDEEEEEEEVDCEEDEE